MKAVSAPAALVLLFSLLASVMAAAELREKTSLLNNDPEVVYTGEFTDKKIELLVVKSATVYATKKGGR